MGVRYNFANDSFYLLVARYGDVINSDGWLFKKLKLQVVRWLTAFHEIAGEYLPLLEMTKTAYDRWLTPESRMRGLKFKVTKMQQIASMIAHETNILDYAMGLKQREKKVLRVDQLEYLASVQECGHFKLTCELMTALLKEYRHDGPTPARNYDGLNQGWPGVIRAFFITLLVWRQRICRQFVP